MLGCYNIDKTTHGCDRPDHQTVSAALQNFSATFFPTPPSRPRGWALQSIGPGQLRNNGNSCAALWVWAAFGQQRWQEGRNVSDFDQQANKNHQGCPNHPCLGPQACSTCSLQLETELYGPEFSANLAGLALLWRQMMAQIRVFFLAIFEVELAELRI